MLASLALLPPAPAEAETTLLSATLTVGSRVNDRTVGSLVNDPWSGCARPPGLGLCSTQLSNNSFTYDGQTYRVTELTVSRSGNMLNNIRLRLGFNKTLPEAIRAGGTLTLDGINLPFADGHHFSPFRTPYTHVKWDNINLSLWDNQQVTVVLTLETTPPTVSSATVNGTSLAVTFSEPMSSGKADKSAFAVSVTGASDPTVSSYSLSGSTARLTLSSAVTAGQTVKVAYTKPNTGTVLQDVAGNDLASFTAMAVTNKTGDTTAPAFSSATVDGKFLVVTFSEPMDTTAKTSRSFSKPYTGGAFTVDVDSVTDPYKGTTEEGVGWVLDYTLSGSTARLSLATAVGAEQTVKVAYTKPNTGTVLQDVAGNDLASFTAKAVTNNTDTTVPTVSSYSPSDDDTSVAVGANLVLTFDGPVKKGASGNIVIKPSEGTDISIPVTDSQVSIGTGANNNVVTINPTNDLSANTAHSVRIDSGAIKDLADNHYRGIANDTTWNFTTAQAGGSGQEDNSTASVSLSAAPDPVEEGLPVTVTATLSAGLARAVTIPLVVTDVTSEVTDYGALPSIVIAAGDTTGTSAMTTAIDGDGDDETFRVGLATANLPSGVTAGDPASDTVTITDTTTGSAEPLPALFPNPPTTVQAHPGNGQVVLTWSDVAGAGGWEVRQGAEGAWTATGGTARTHTVTGLTNGNSYTFYVRATGLLPVLKGNVSAGVTETAGAPAAPAAVASVRVLHKGNKLSVSWDAPARATHYDVTYTNTGSGQNARAAWNRAGESLEITCDVRPDHLGQYCVNAAGTYTVGVRARNAGGESAWVNSAAAAFSAPPAPASVSVTHNGGSLSVSWPASTGAENYRVAYSSDGGSSWSTATPKQTGTSLTIGGVDTGTTYTVRVRAKNGAGESAWTNSSPASVTAPAAVASVTVVHNGGKLAVAWDAPARATHYDVTYTNTSSGQNARAAWNRAGTSLEITCDVRPDHLGQYCVNAAGTYTVGVRARNAGGESAWTNSEPVAGPALTVADATVSEPSEGTTANLAFVVTLAPASSETVTVAYATADGTATAGSDYTATSGTLSFAAGETAKTISVPVLADAQDDGGETLTLTLSTPSGARITDGTATGTITNDGHIPQAWIGRFGRTVAHQVLDAVEGRMQTPSTPGREVVIAGAHFHGLAKEVTGLEVATLRDRNLLTSSSFALTSEAAAGELRWSLWGRGALTSFDGRQDALTLDGNVTSALLGADWTWDYATTPEAGTSDGEAWGDGRWRAGLLLSHSRGDGNYSAADHAGEGGSPPGGMAGKVKAHLTGLFPWARRALNRQLAAWGVAGYGQGELTVTAKGAAPKADGADLNADLNLWMAAGGLRGTLIDGGSDGLTVTGTTDAMAVGTSSGSVTGADGTLAAAQATVTRLRLGLTAQRPFLLGNREADNGATLTPSLELGLRHDGGDAETGFGLDLGGGIVLSAPEQGLAAELRGRALLSHAAEGFRDQGFSGSLSWHQEPASDRGAVLSLTHTLGGASSGGAEALLSRVNLEGLAANNDDQDRLKNQRLEVQLSYGLPAFGDRLTLTPELGLGLYDSGRDYRIGWNLTQPDAGESFQFSFDATRREDNNGTAPEHGIELRLDTRF